MTSQKLFNTQAKDAEDLKLLTRAFAEMEQEIAILKKQMSQILESDYCIKCSSEKKEKISRGEDIALLKQQIKIIFHERRHPNKDCFTAKEVAEMAGVTAETVKSWEKKGLRVAFPNTKKRYDPSDVEWYLRGNPSEARKYRKSTKKLKG